MRFDLTDLRLFLAVVERGSLTQGARATHLALASVSERIAAMEQTLGTPLLERNRRGVRSTAAGQALVRHARLILGQVEQMRGELRTYATGLKGRIKLQSNTAALAAFLPEQLHRFLLNYPDLSIDLEERTSVEIVQNLMHERTELGIVADVADMGSLERHWLAQDQLVAIAHRAHPLASGSAIPFAALLDEAFVGCADAALEAHLAEQAARFGRQLAYRVQLRSVAHVAALVEAGVGIAILPAASARALDRMNLHISPLSDGWATRRLFLCARKFAALTPLASLLAQQLVEAAGRMPPGS